MSDLVVEIQHYSWKKQDGKWYAVGRYPNTEEGNKAARSDEQKFKVTYGYYPAEGKPLVERPCRIRLP
jgi:hypothetical protein